MHRFACVRYLYLSGKASTNIGIIMTKLLIFSELKVFKNVASQLEDTMTFAYNNDGAASKMYV